MGCSPAGACSRVLVVAARCAAPEAVRPTMSVWPVPGVVPLAGVLAVPRPAGAHTERRLTIGGNSGIPARVSCFSSCRRSRGRGPSVRCPRRSRRLTSGGAGSVGEQVSKVAVARDPDIGEPLVGAAVGALACGQAAGLDVQEPGRDVPAGRRLGLALAGLPPQGGGGSCMTRVEVRPMNATGGLARGPFQGMIMFAWPLPVFPESAAGVAVPGARGGRDVLEVAVSRSPSDGVAPRGRELDCPVDDQASGGGGGLTAALLTRCPADPQPGETLPGRFHDHGG